MFSLLLVSCIAPSPGSPAPTATTEAIASPTSMATTTQGASDNSALLPAEAPPFDTTEWRTDFSRRTVEWNEIRSGGVPKDAIPAVDEPTFENVSAASWLSERDPVIYFEHAGEVRAYPLAILIWHEIVNDTVAGKAITVTFCPLCNASIIFDSTIDGRRHDFGTTGRLRNSDLVMYDRQTESWWQQFTGQGLIGEYAGRELNFLPSQVISFGDFAAEFPNGKVLQRPGSNRNYGVNPYTNYDSSSGRPFLYDGELDTRLPAIERVVGIAINAQVKAYPFANVAELGAINDEVGGGPIVVLHKSGTASALDASVISESRDIGSIAVFQRQLGERTLTFSANSDGTFTDAETSSTWNILGQSIAGQLKGEQLTRILSFDHFWFAWSAFYPETEIYQ